MDGVCGVGSNSRSSYDDDRVCADDDVKKRAEADAARKRADAEAAARYAHYAGGAACTETAGADAGSCGRGLPIRPQTINLNNRVEVKRYLDRIGALQADATNGSPHELAWLKSQEPALRAAQQKFLRADYEAAKKLHAEQAAAAERKAKVDAVVQPGRKLDSIDNVASEIFRLKSEAARPHEDFVAHAINTRVAELQRAWIEKAHAAGLKPPSTIGINAAGASDEDLNNALRWSELGGVVPINELMTDGGDSYRRGLLEEAIIRRPGGLELLLTQYADDPSKQKQLLRGALQRVGADATCRADDTPQSLATRYYDFLAWKKGDADEKIRAMPHMGLDGLVFRNEQDAARYEMAQYVAAIRGETTLGSLAASWTAIHGGSVDEIRQAGHAGDALENALGGKALVVKKNPAPHPEGELSARRPSGRGAGTGPRVRANGAADPGAREKTELSAAERATYGGSGPVKKGEAGVKKSIEQAKKNGETVKGTEVTFDTKAGVRVRVDVLTGKDDKVKGIDAKHGPNAKLTENQKVGYPSMQEGGAIPRGKNAEKAGLTPGQPMGPIDIQIDHW